MAPIIGHSVDEVDSTLGCRCGSSVSIHHNPEHIFFLPFILLNHFHPVHPPSLHCLPPSVAQSYISHLPSHISSTRSTYPPETPHHPTCPTPTTHLNPAPVPPESGPSRQPVQTPRPTLLAMDRDLPRPTSPTPYLARLGEDTTDLIVLIPIIAVPRFVHLNSPARNPRRKPDMILVVIFLPITLPITHRVHLVTIARSRR